MPDPSPLSWWDAAPYFGTALLLGYLLGSIPFGMLLTRLAGLGDIRRIGSGNIGATNVLRTGRKDLAAATVLLDGGKGTVAALIGAQYGPDMMVIAGFGAFLGHLFPVWLGFRGGKGVATFLGVLFGFGWPLGLIAGAIWIVTAALFRFSSLAALVAALATPVIAWQLYGPQLAEVTALIAALIVVRHHQNILRLIKGEEPKIGQKKS